MTEEELMALPEYKIVTERRVTDERGRVTIYPVIQKRRAFSVSPDDYAWFLDSNGQAWTTGWIDGVQYRMKQDVLF